MSKGDLKGPYLHLPIDLMSKLFTTINLRRRLLWHDRLKLGIVSSPEIFYRCMDNLLQEIPIKCGYQDNIIISGWDDDHYIQTDETVFKTLSGAGICVRQNTITL